MEGEFSTDPVLVGQTGPLNGEQWVINKTLTIGRDPTNDIVITDRQISRQHARVTIDPLGFLIEDLDSKNGTYVNDLKLEAPKYIQDGDVITIALVQHFVFLGSDTTMPMSNEPLPGRRLRAGLEVDTKARNVIIDGNELSPALSVQQFNLVQALSERPGEVISREQLIERIWGVDEMQGVSEQALDALIRRLRDRIAQIDPTHDYIVTVRGYGLRLDNKE